MRCVEMKIVDWHKNYTKWWQRKLGMSDYAFLWLAFSKGALGTIIVYLVVCDASKALYMDQI